MLMALALIPAVGLLITIYCCDRNKEPKGLLVGIFFAGMATVISALILETIGKYFLENMVYDYVLQAFLMAFIIVGPAEELGKYLVMRWITWNNRHFDYLFDGIVYAVFSSLGFAALENVCYVFSNGVTTGIVRMFSSVPGHACFGVFMGFFYSKAKHASATGNKGKCFINKCLAIIVPSLLHGLYDALLMIAEASYSDGLETICIILWIVVLIAMFVCTIIMIVKTSKNDYCIVVIEDNPPVVYRPKLLGQWTCRCGRTNERNFCPVCGEKRPITADWYCTGCGSRSYWNFCGQCGAAKAGGMTGREI